MWEKIKAKSSLIIGGLIALLYLLFKWEKGQKEKAEAKLLTAESDKKDAVLAEKQAQVERDIEAEKSRAEAEKGRKLSPEEMEEYLKKL